MEEQENIGENKAIWSTSSLHVAVECGIVASLSHTNEETWSSTPQMAAKHPGHLLEGQGTRWQMRKSERQLHSPSWKTLLDADDRGGSTSSRMECHRIPRQAHHWEPDCFRRRPGRQRQNWRGVISKDLNKIGIDGMRYRRQRMTGKAGGIWRLWRTMNQEP